MTIAAPRQRLAYVDALRGLAATAVVLYHLEYNPAMQELLAGFYPRWLQQIFEHGSLGVEIFFVLSGFVIVYSLRNVVLDRRGAGSFVVRRQLRLDPPYWAMLAIVVVGIPVQNALGLNHDSIPGPGVISLNALYLHNIFDVRQVVGVSWTLCIEIQFYLFLLLVAAFPRVVGRVSPSDRSRPSVLGQHMAPLLLLTGIASVIIAHTWSNDDWFIHYWMFFAVGALFCLYVLDVCSWRWAAAMVLIFTGTALATGDQVPMAIAAFIAVAVLAAGQANVGVVHRVADTKVLQYLGSRSYSIYLVHQTVLTTVLRVGVKTTGQDHAAAMAWIVLAAIASFVAAELFFRLIEKPSLRISASVKANGLPRVRSRARTSRESVEVTG